MKKRNYFPIPWYKQVLVWIFFIGFYFIFKKLILGNSFVGNNDFALYIIITIAFFYLNMLWILPRFVGFGPKFYYKLILFLGLEFLALMCLIVLISVPLGGMQIQFEGYPIWPWITNFFHISFLFFHGFLWSGLGYVFLWGFHHKRETMQVGKDVDQLKKQAEINRQNWLKAVLNPHLLYNMLPMLEYTIEHKPKKAIEALKILNDMMVYYLRYAKDGLILILEELEQAKSLIALNQIRLNRKASLNLTVSGDLDTVKVPSMLVLLLVENIFKYGVLDDPDYPAKVNVGLENNHFSIYTENKINKLPSDSSTGLGLQNLKERLEYFYPDRHDFEAGAQGDVFIVYLRLR